MVKHYVFLAQIPKEESIKKYWNGDFSSSVKRCLEECFEGSTIEKIKDCEGILNLPKNEHYSEIYLISTHRMTEEMRDLVKKKFSNCKYKLLPFECIS